MIQLTITIESNFRWKKKKKIKKRGHQTRSHIVRTNLPDFQRRAFTSFWNFLHDESWKSVENWNFFSPTPNWKRIIIHFHIVEGENSPLSGPWKPWDLRRAWRTKVNFQKVLCRNCALGSIRPIAWVTVFLGKSTCSVKARNAANCRSELFSEIWISLQFPIIY